MEQAGKRSRSIAAAAAIVALLAGCQRSLDMDDVRSAISDGVLEQVGLAISEVDCPESIAMEAGASFECTAIPGEGGKLMVQVTQNDDQGNVTWEVVESEGLLDLVALESTIAAGLLEQAGISASVECGDKYRVVEPGNTFQCTAEDAEGRQGQVTVTMEDNEGNVSWALE
ncbi:MAG: DUF4333 domain-containing protein [Gemmatimonadota bacterium]|nr:MAG: DUF4333 domain-containing protein [Gemmatimonadota bacterium]